MSLCKFRAKLKRADNYRTEVFEADYKHTPRERYPIPTYLPKELKALMASGWELVSITPCYKPAKGAAAKEKRKKKEDSSRGMKPMIYTPQKAELSADAAECARIIAQIIGMGEKSQEKGRYNLDVVGFATSYEKGENPIPYLSKPVEAVRRPCLLVSPDDSGSCHEDSGFIWSFCNQLARHYQVFMQRNWNGRLSQPVEAEVDLILYIGDEDFFMQGENALNEINTRVIGLSNVACNHKKPALLTKLSTPKRAWVEHVSLKVGSDYMAALKIAAKYFQS
jgi:hypothetical protein